METELAYLERYELAVLCYPTVVATTKPKFEQLHRITSGKLRVAPWFTELPPGSQPSGSDSCEEPRHLGSLGRTCYRVALQDVVTPHLLEWFTVTRSEVAKAFPNLPICSSHCAKMITHNMREHNERFFNHIHPTKSEDFCRNMPVF